MKSTFLCCFVGLLGTLLFTATTCFSYTSFADTVPAGLICTDSDGDNYAVEGGGCGPVDCDDADAAIHPGATENCRDSIDNNCNDLIDEMDPTAIACLECIDGDGDYFFSEGGACGEADCNDTDASINPDAVDIPNNGIDENCSGADSSVPSATDSDGDGYNVDVDCNDTDAAINPGTSDIPNNNIDENCDGIDSVDPANVDNDGDGFTPATGDCDDTDVDVNPNAIEHCTDNIDNNCNDFVDLQDPVAVDCEMRCIDNDGDSYAIEGGDCGPVDCNDNDTEVNPGSGEICGDGIDNDCDSLIDEGCEETCPDLDGDGYQDAACGGTDCNDTDAGINPAASEVCGNGVDENCNGASDDTCLTCLDGTMLVIKKMEYNRGDGKLHLKGRATVGSSIKIIDADTEKILNEGISVNNGKWEAEIEDNSNMLENITVFTSTGCLVNQQIKPREDHNDHDDDDDNDDGYKKERDNTKS